MWNRQRILSIGLILMFCSFRLFPQELNQITIAWKEAPGAVTYKIEIKDALDRVVYQQDTEKTSVKVYLAPGGYSKRISTTDKTGEVEKGEWLPLEVISKVFEEKSNLKIKIEWKEIPEVNTYALEIQDLKGKTIFLKKTKNTKIDLSLPPGKYLKRVYVQDKTGEFTPTEWTNLEVIQKKSKREYDIVARSLAFPGWGQVYAGSKYDKTQYKIRGYITMGLSAFRLHNYYMFRNESFRQQRHFQSFATNSILFSELAGDSLYPIQNEYNFYVLSELKNQKKQTDRATQNANQAITTFLIVYIIQLLDATRIQYFEVMKLSASIEQNNKFFSEYYYTVSLDWNF